VQFSVISALDRVDDQHHVPAAMPMGKRPDIHCTGGWMGTRSYWDGCGNSRRHPVSIRGPCSSYLVAIPAELGHAVVQSVEALRYKSEGRGFDFRWCHWNVSLT
jgi:hypothetical protein